MKSCLFLVVGVLLVDVLWAQDVAISCSTRANILCKPKGLDEFANNGKQYPDADMLNRHCDEYVRAFECFVDYEKTCLPEGEHAFGSQKRTQDMGILLKDVCDKDSLVGKGYREHVDCFNTNAEAIETCGRNGTHAGEMYKASIVREFGSMTEEDSDKIDCVVQAMIYNCMEFVIHHSCGEQAEVIAKELLDRMRGPLDPICTEANWVEVEQRFSAYLDEEDL